MLRKIVSFLLTLLLVAGCFSACTTDEILDPSTNTTATTVPTESIPEGAGFVIGSEILNYFYLDAVQQQYASWSNTFGDSTDSYLSMYFGLDTSRALDQQIYDQENALTWADLFIEAGKEDAISSYAIYELAKSQNYKLTDEAKEEFDSWVSMYEMYAQLYNTSMDEMIASGYGEGATFEGWKDYLMCVITAQDYAKTYAESLVFDEATLRETESGREAEFSSYSFATYHISYTKYTELGTTGDNGSVSFDDTQKAAALEAAKADAQSLTAAKTIEELNSKIAALPFNSGVTNVVCEAKEDAAYSEISELLRDWITDSARKSGECTVIANETVSTSSDGTETTALNGYYVVLFTDFSDNRTPLANVRHLVILAEDDEATSKKKVEELFEEWKKNPTEENFIALTKENSDDSSAEYGGLYEDLAPNSPYVPEFLGWALDESREPGDCDIIKTQYGYHLMYYVSDDEILYRDLLISQELEEKAYNAWYDALIEAFEVTFINEDKLKTNYIISPGA